jgi:Uma2 family endonuclease
VNEVTAELLNGTATIDDYDALPDDGRHYELIDGRIVVSPSAMPTHSRVILKLAYALEQALPPGHTLLSDLDVAMTDRHQCPRPDLMVVPEASADENRRMREEDVLLAVEVLSPGSRQLDRQIKPRIYANAGIPAYWIVETEPFGVVEHHLVGRKYEEIQRATGDQIAVTRPFDLMVSLADARAITLRAARRVKR